MKRLRLFWHIVPGPFVLTAICSILILWTAGNTLRNHHIEQRIKIHSNVAETLQQVLRAKPDAQHKAHLLETVLQFADTLSLQIEIVDHKGDSLFLRLPHFVTSSIISSVQSLELQESFSRIETESDGEYLYSVVPAPQSETQPTFIVIRESTRSVHNSLLELKKTSAAIVFLVLIIAAAISLIISKRLSYPIRILTDQVIQFANGNPSLKFHVPEQKELAHLSAAMTSTADKVEQKLLNVLQQRKELDAILRSMSEGVIVVDKHGTVLRINERCASFFGIQNTPVHGKTLQELIRNTTLQDLLSESLQTQQTTERDMVIGLEDPRVLQASASPLVDADGESIGSLAVLHDITSIRQMEQMRKEFVANVSHELRTPITSIKGFVETLLDGALKEPETAHKFLQIIQRQANRLDLIIDDLLSLSRLERDGSGEINKQTVRILEALNSAITLCEQAAKEKSIDISVECNDQITAQANPHLLEQAITNLIENAVKYSDKETNVLVKAFVQSDRLHISVVDNGPGIDSKHISRLFERFYRVDAGRSRQQGGTGLGLAIVKHIAQAHGGRASIESSEGNGSQFSIIIPTE